MLGRRRLVRIPSEAHYFDIESNCVFRALRSVLTGRPRSQQSLPVLTFLQMTAILSSR